HDEEHWREFLALVTLVETVHRGLTLKLLLLTI
ncbi:MAG: hypothetical protein ACI9EX_002178, partial [Oleispira sp.]